MENDKDGPSGGGKFFVYRDWSDFSLKTMLYPFLPFSSQKLHEYLGFEGKIENSKWEVCIPEPGQKLVEPKAMFTKLDDGIIEKETLKLGH